MKYNGWTNHETWNAYNWATSSEYYYNAFKNASADKAKSTWEFYFGEGHDGIKISNVNWSEFAEAMSE